MRDGKVTPGEPSTDMLAALGPADRDGLARAALRAGLAPET